MQLAYLLKKVLGCDFGLVRYLAPEYTQSGQITDKADVYSFGVVLLELITGRKAVDLNRPRGEQCLTEWARPLLEEKGSLLVDPRLENRYSDFELHCMLHAAACCIRRDPQQRPRMSQVLRMLEGEIAIDTISASPPPAYLSRKPSFDGLLEQKPKAESSGTPRIKPLTSLIIPLKSQQSNSATSLCQGPTIVDLSLKNPDFVTSCESGYVKRLSTQPSLPATPSSSKLSFEALRAAYEEKAHHTHILTSAY
jgi:serine/threonine protein kinase